MKTKIEIKSIFGNVLFEFEKENNTIKDTLMEAIKGGANLRCANLRGVDLYGANLRCANLRGVDLYGADLRGANLYGANLRGANLRGANLRGANLRGVDLYGADLYGVDLRGVDLYGANLRCANLRGVDLYGADLYGVDLYGADLYGVDLGEWGKLQSNSSVLVVGAIGSRNGYTTIFHTDKGVFVQCGCFKGTLYEFEVKVKETHHGNKHERDYLALIQFAKIKFEL